MTKQRKTNLAEALHQASGKQSNVVIYKKENPDSEEPNIVTEKPRMPLPPSRKGKRVISSYFDPAVSQQLKRLAVDKDTTIQALLTEAINDLFEKYHLNPFAK